MEFAKPDRQRASHPTPLIQNVKNCLCQNFFCRHHLMKDPIYSCELKTEAMKVCLSVVPDSFKISLNVPSRRWVPWGGKTEVWDNLGKMQSCLRDRALCRWSHFPNGRGWGGCGLCLLEVGAPGCDCGHDFVLIQGRIVLLLFHFCTSLVIISSDYIRKPLCSHQFCCLEKYTTTAKMIPFHSSFPALYWVSLHWERQEVTQGLGLGFASWWIFWAPWIERTSVLVWS